MGKIGQHGLAPFLVAAVMMVTGDDGGVSEGMPQGLFSNLAGLTIPFQLEVTLR